MYGTNNRRLRQLEQALAVRQRAAEEEQGLCSACKLCRGWEIVFADEEGRPFDGQKLPDPCAACGEKRYSVFKIAERDGRSYFVDLKPRTLKAAAMMGLCKPDGELIFPAEPDPADVRVGQCQGCGAPRLAISGCQTIGCQFGPSPNHRHIPAFV